MDSLNDELRLREPKVSLRIFYGFCEVMRSSLSLLLLFTSTLTVSDAESYFPKTPVGEVDLKEIPAAKRIATNSDQQYFSESNKPFTPGFLKRFEAHASVVERHGEKASE